LSDVATPSKEHKEAQVRLQLPRALMGGTREMRKKGEAFLPREPDESDALYKRRLARSKLFNGFRKTVRDMTGKVFAKPIALGDDMPEVVQGWCENIDLAGRNLQVFARDVFADGLVAGVSYIHVDMPPAIPNATLADERRMGMRPYFVHVPAEHLLGWKSETIGGVETLTQARIMECVSEPDGEWHEKDVHQVRVLLPGAWQIWRQMGEKNEWMLYAEGTTSLNAIPLVPFYACRTGFMTGEPPLEDLAFVNEQHWQSESDQRNILHVARVPILFMAGIPEADVPNLKVSANALTTAQAENARLEYVEHSGRAISSGREDLKDLEFQMSQHGMELILPTPGTQTATGKAIDSAAMHAPLAAMALNLQDALEEAFAYAGEYAGLGDDGAGSVTVNTDFGVSMRDAADLTALVQMRNAGDITRERLLMEMKRRGVLADDLDIEAELDELENEAPALGMISQPLSFAPTKGERVDVQARGDDE
jgi:hypothetical protein